MKKTIHLFLLCIIFFSTSCVGGESFSEQEETSTVEIKNERSKTGSCCASSIATDSTETNHNN